MTTLDLRSAQRDQNGQLVTGQGTAYVSSRFQTGTVVPLTLPSFARDIKQEIIRAVATGGLLTRAEIAKAVGRKKTRWLNDQIEDLVSRGYLRRHQGHWRRNAPIYYYEVTL